MAHRIKNNFIDEKREFSFVLIFVNFFAIKNTCMDLDRYHRAAADPSNQRKRISRS
jgi:hypothetical protein